MKKSQSLSSLPDSVPTGAFNNCAFEMGKRRIKIATELDGVARSYNFSSVASVTPFTYL